MSLLLFFLCPQTAMMMSLWHVPGQEEGRKSGSRADGEVGGKKRERGGTRCCFFFLKKRSGDGKLWHIDRSWTTTTVRPAGQTEREVKSRRAHTPPPLPEKSFSLEFAVTPAIATPVEEIICASRRVITEAECEIAVTKLCLWPHDQPETSTLLHTHYFIPPLLPLCSSLTPFIFITPSFVISLYFYFFHHQVRLII